MYVNTIAHSLLVHSADSIKRNFSFSSKMFPNIFRFSGRPTSSSSSNSYFYLDEAASRKRKVNCYRRIIHMVTETKKENLIDFSSRESFSSLFAFHVGECESLLNMKQIESCAMMEKKWHSRGAFSFSSRLPSLLCKQHIFSAHTNALPVISGRRRPYHPCTNAKQHRKLNAEKKAEKIDIRFKYLKVEWNVKSAVFQLNTSTQAALSRRPAVAQLHAEPNVLPDSCFASKNVIQSSSYSSQQLFPYFLINLCITLQIT